MTKDRALVMMAGLIDAIEGSLDEAYLSLVEGEMDSPATFDAIEDALFYAQDDLCTLVGWEHVTRPSEPEDAHGTGPLTRDELTSLRSTATLAQGLLDQVSEALVADVTDTDLIDEDLQTLQGCVTDIAVLLGVVGERTSRGGKRS